MALTDSIAAYYKLQGNSNDSVNSNNGTDTGITYSDSYGKIGNGILCDNSTSHIIVAQNSTIDDLFQTGGSIAFWMYAVGASTSNYLFGKGYEGYWDCGVTAVSGSTFKLRFTRSFSVLRGQWRNTNYDFSTGTWYHVVITYDASSLLNDPIFYINGSSTSIDEVTAPTGTYQSDNSATVPRLVMGALNDSPNPAAPWNGYMDEIGLWKRILTSGEASSLYNGGTGLQYPFSTTAIKTWNGLADASTKTFNGLARASVKTRNGLA